MTVAKYETSTTTGEECALSQMARKQDHRGKPEALSTNCGAPLAL